MVALERRDWRSNGPQIGFSGDPFRTGLSILGKTIPVNLDAKTRRYYAISNKKSKEQLPKKIRLYRTEVRKIEFFWLSSYSRYSLWNPVDRVDILCVDPMCGTYVWILCGYMWTLCGSLPYMIGPYMCHI